VEISGPVLGKGADCEPVLRDLPEWFGIESAIVHYVDSIDRMPTFLAAESGAIIGFLTVCRHFPVSAEIYVMAIARKHHRLGIGRCLIDRAEAWLCSEGVRFLQVKTLSASHPDPNYASTRRFYERMGFSPLEELITLWDPSNPCLLLVKTLAPPAIGP